MMAGSSSELHLRQEHRPFGEEIDPNHVLNMSLLSLDSKDTAPTSVLTDDHGGSVADSDCGTEVSAVAHLRDWLDEFGKNNKSHFQKNSVVGQAPSDICLEKPLRPKVSRASTNAPPTPLPFAAANAFNKRVVHDPLKANSSRRASLGVPHKTPVLFKPKFNKQEVEATDSGYASVAKLSAWLADDPTRSRKVKQLRRGANIISKSRIFDKGLADVIVEQTSMRSGHVAAKKNGFDSSTSGDSDEVAEAQPCQKDDFNLPSVSVSDKLKWLSGAFVKEGENRACNKSSLRKAQTDVITSRDEKDDLTHRAKQMWRNKRSPMRRKTNSVSNSVVGSAHGVSTAKSEIGKTTAVAESQVVTGEAPSSPSKALDTSQVRSSAESCATPSPTSKTMSFSSARRLLVERAKANGSATKIVTKVQRRKVKYERFRGSTIQLSSPHGLLKPSWVTSDDGVYVKTYREDHPEQKELSELP